MESRVYAVFAPDRLKAGLQTRQNENCCALHTHVETARQILYEQGGDFLLTVKGNQPTVKKTLDALFANRAFSPSADLADPHHAGREEPRPG